MQTKHRCVLIHILTKGELDAPLKWFKPSSKIFYWPFQCGTSFVDLLCFCSVLCLLCLCARLFICTLRSPAGKGLTSWLSFVVSNCEFVTFLGQVWFLIVSILDLCTLTYFQSKKKVIVKKNAQRTPTRLKSNESTVNNSWSVSPDFSV